MATVTVDGMEVDLGELTLEEVDRMQLPIKICHCPECFPDPRCDCDDCEYQRQRLVLFLEGKDVPPPRYPKSWGFLWALPEGSE